MTAGTAGGWTGNGGRVTPGNGRRDDRPRGNPVIPAGGDPGSDLTAPARAGGTLLAPGATVFPR